MGHFSATATTEPIRYPWRTALLTVGVVLVVLFLRRPEAFIHPTLWAEDGSVFLAQCESLGAGSILVPYNGYYHVLQRLVALAVSPLPLRWIPLAYLLASVAVLAALALALFSPRLPVRGRPLMALAPVLVPHSGEVLDTLTNIQWLGALGLLLLVLAANPDSPWQRSCDLLAATILGLTGIFALLFAPFFLWRTWRRRDFHSGVLAGVVGACAAIQAGALVRSGLLVPETWKFTGSIARTVALRTSGSLALPPAFAQAWPTWALVVLACAMLALLVQSAFIDRAFRPGHVILLLGALLLVAGTLYRFHGDVLILRPVTNGDRYFFVPKVLCLWLFIWRIQLAGFGRWAARAVCAVCLIATAASWRFERYHDFGWAEHVAQLDRSAEVTIPINPSGQTVRLRARRPHRD